MQMRERAASQQAAQQSRSVGSVKALWLIIRILRLKARSSDAGEPHAEKLRAPWSDCETNHTAAAEGLCLFPDRQIQNQTLRLIESHAFLWGHKASQLIRSEMLLLQ